MDWDCCEVVKRPERAEFLSKRMLILMPIYAAIAWCLRIVGKTTSNTYLYLVEEYYRLGYNAV
jgi:hypothetical protein